MAHLTNVSFENFHIRCISTFSIPWCKKVKNDQKLKSIASGGGGGVCLKRRPRHLSDHYRPISLLLSVTKVLESLVNKYLPTLSADNLISLFQSGFRHGDSTPYNSLVWPLSSSQHWRAEKSLLQVFMTSRKGFASVLRLVVNTHAQHRKDLRKILWLCNISVAVN